jgi:hypothetical protein
MAERAAHLADRVSPGFEIEILSDVGFVSPMRTLTCGDVFA